jgi:hypothetical protein
MELVRDMQVDVIGLLESDREFLFVGRSRQSTASYTAIEI